MSSPDRNEWMNNINNETLEAWHAFSEWHDLDEFNETEFNNWFNNHASAYGYVYSRPESPIQVRRARASTTPRPPEIQRQARRVDVLGVYNTNNTFCFK